MVEDFFIGKGWKQGAKEKVIALEILEEEYLKQPIVTNKSGKKVRYIIVGERKQPDTVSHATHYVAKDTKVKSNERKQTSGD